MSRSPGDLKNFLNCFFALTAFFALVACSKKTEQTDNGQTDLVQPQAILSAKLDGRDWLFKSGVARDSMADLNSYTVILYESGEGAADPCTYFAPLKESTILLTIQRNAGVKPLGPSKAVVFHLGAGNNQKLESRDGAIWIDSIGELVQGSLIANIDSNNSASGSFVATICR